MLAAGGSATVAASLFLPWFQQQAGRVVIPGLPSFSTAQAVVRTSDAFGAGLWHWVICVISVLVVGYVAARILPGRNARLPLPHWQMLTVATVLNAGLVLMSVGLPPDSGHWSLGVGAELAVIASLIALGGAILRHGYPEVITRGRPRRTGRAARSTLAVRKVRPDRPTRAVRSAGARRGADPERAARNKRPEPKPRAEGNARPERRPRPEHNRRAERNTRSEGVRRTEQERRAEGETRAELGESTDFSTSSGSESPIYSFSTRAMATARQTMPEMDDDLECRFCGTLNNSSARVCRGCGVVTTVRLER